MEKFKNKPSKEQTFYQEIRGIKKWWIFVVLIIELLFFGGVIFRQIVMGIPFGPYPVTNTGIIIISLLFIIPLASFLVLHIHIEVNNAGVSYQMKPIERKKHLLKADTIIKYFIRTRKSSKSNNKNSKGLVIELANGKHIFLPSRNPNQLLQATHLMMQENQNLKKYDNRN